MQPIEEHHSRIQSFRPVKRVKNQTDRFVVDLHPLVVSGPDGNYILPDIRVILSKDTSNMWHAVTIRNRRWYSVAFPHPAHNWNTTSWGTYNNALQTAMYNKDYAQAVNIVIAWAVNSSSARDENYKQFTKTRKPCGWQVPAQV